MILVTWGVSTRDFKVRFGAKEKETAWRKCPSLPPSRPVSPKPSANQGLPTLIQQKDYWAAEAEEHKEKGEKHAQNVLTSSDPNEDELGSRHNRYAAQCEKWQEQYQSAIRRILNGVKRSSPLNPNR